MTAKDNQGKIYSRIIRLLIKSPTPAPENPPTESIRKFFSPSFKEIVLILASIIGIILLISRSFDRTTFEDKTILSSVEQTTKSIEPQNPYPLTGEETILEFFSLINDKNYVQAYSLTSNAFWKNFPYFRDSVWGLFEKYEITQQPETKHYQSKWNADRIYNLKFSGWDPKLLKYKDMDYDFHLKKVEDEWTIIRMTFSQKNEPWYQDDPLYKTKNDLFALLFNRPHVILQNYYDNFSHIDSLYKNKEYYNDVLIIHFDDTMISAEEALLKDRNDFQINNIESYGILVNSYSMMTYQYEKLDLVYTPLVYYITKTDGKRIKFEASITAALDTKNNKILAIGQDFNMEDLVRVVQSYQ